MMWLMSIIWGALVIGSQFTGDSSEFLHFAIIMSTMFMLAHLTIHEIRKLKDGDA